MKIVIKTKNLKLTRALEDFIEEKINDLEKFVNIFHYIKFLKTFQENLFFLQYIAKVLCLILNLLF